VGHISTSQSAEDHKLAHKDRRIATVRWKISEKKNNPTRSLRRWISLWIYKNRCIS